ncbi:MAG: aspartate carbamoyltransferase catalytic subunit [Candidatus Omnitrophota bacterium]|jgi:aspartate carbamoyltransferase catalytic subunit
MGQWSHRHLVDLQNLSKEDIEIIFETANSFKEVSTRDVKKVPTLRGKSVICLFFEPSTRTRVSFELAAKRLSADTINVSGSSSSLSKGETVLDTAKNLEAMNVDILIVRHGSAGIPKVLADNCNASIVNAGDGMRAHPSQALLDMYTIKEKFGKIEGLHVGILGDILHSRVARSNIIGLLKMGAKVTVFGPKTLLPKGIESYGVDVASSVDDLISKVDVLMLLRLQQERQKEKFLPSIREYSTIFGVNSERLKSAKKDILIMHPGPTNRGVELSASVADGSHSVILNQVTNGIAIRMAILYLISTIRDGNVRK